MSRPPIPRGDATSTSVATGDPTRLDYLPLAYDDLRGLEDDMAVTQLGRPPGAPSQDAEPDAAATLMELSALVGHVLSIYQSHYAGEAFIGTAQAPSSLVRHAHRLAYDPDPGLSATGYVVLYAKPGAAGTVAAGLQLASVPLGDSKAQDYETRDDLNVEAALNELFPVDARRAITIVDTDTTVVLQGVGYGLGSGDVAALVGSVWRGYVVADVTEDRAAGITTVTLDRAVGPSATPAGTTLLAHPSLTLRPFAADADATLYPPADVKTADGTEPDAASGLWYTVQRADGGGYNAADFYLSEQLKSPLSGQFVLRSTGTFFGVFTVTAEAVASVTLNQKSTETFTTHTVTLTPTSGGGFTSSLTPTTGTQTVTDHVSGTVTAIRLQSRDGTAALRSQQQFPADWISGWRVEAPLAADEPNPAAVTEPLSLPGVLTSFTPGRPLVFSSRDGTKTQIVVVRRATFDEDAQTTAIWWDAVTDPPRGGWQLADLKVLGNVARISHGRTVQETLGSSDGVSPFQRFALRESPVTVLPSAAGGDPALVVRVDAILWERVQDFALSGSADRHYCSVTDETGATSVLFGDGRNGAVPPSGTANITAAYRVGLGSAGNVDAARLSRLKRANPLLDHAINVTPVAGGAEPAAAAAIRTQATRWIRTFDRAVSTSDLADLALTMPGIARAASQWDQSAGATLIVATERGEAPPALDAVRAFLDTRRDTSVPLQLRGPQPKDVQLTVSVDADPAYLVEVVKNGLRDALFGDNPTAPGMFTFACRDLGQPAFLSEVYRQLEAVAGVVGVEIQQLQATDTDTLAHAITADLDEWLRLLPNNLTLTATAAATTG
jgi:hypothetical protein